jgi:hypothetical protein
MEAGEEESIKREEWNACRGWVCREGELSPLELSRWWELVFGKESMEWNVIMRGRDGNFALRRIRREEERL